MPNTILIVDDNRTYAQWTEAVLHTGGYEAEHATSADSGMAMVREQPDKYVALFSDITMEHPGAGLFLIPKLRRMGYRGVVVLESTGFDYPIIHWLSAWTLYLIGVDGLVIKRKMLRDGKWSIDWISKRDGVADLVRRLQGIVDIPGWEQPK